MEIKQKEFEALLEIMDLGISLRQDQLNGSDLRSGREVLKEYLANKLDTPKVIVVGMNHDLAMSRALVEMKARSLAILDTPDFGERGITINSVNPVIEIKALPIMEDIRIFEYDEERDGINPNGRKKGNSKKRRK